MNTAQGLFTFFLNIINNYIVPVVFAVAFLMFLIGVYRYFIAGGASEEKVQEGQKFVLWSVIGFVIMFSIWGLVNLFINTLGFDSNTRPALPKFGAPGNTTNAANTNAGNPGIPNAPGNTNAAPNAASVPTANTNYNSPSQSAPTRSTGTLTPGGTLYFGDVPYSVITSNAIQSRHGGCPPGFSLGISEVYGPICYQIGGGN
jgi:hypothetical protein